MSDPDDEQRVRLEVIEALLHERARIAGDIVEIVPHTWAIHGSIPVDGEVILAEFEHPETARAVLDQLAAVEMRTGPGNGLDAFMAR